jgi:type II secretory pathway pseudopilin PulG
MGKHIRPPCRRDTEEGYVLVAVVVLIALMVLAMAAALPDVRRDIQRDQELEAMHRGQQYIRAIQLYYRRFRRYPPSVDALLDTNGTRFLRKKYSDPLTRQDDWQPILLGQNHAPLSMTFFGQPLNMGAAVLASNTESAGNPIVGASPPDASSLSPQSGLNAQSSGNNSGQNSASNSSPGTSVFSGQVMGGAGIIGFSSPSPRLSLLIYKTKNRYNEWEFVYDPLADRTIQDVNMRPTPGQPPNVGAPGFGPQGQTVH